MSDRRGRTKQSFRFWFPSWRSPTQTSKQPKPPLLRPQLPPASSPSSPKLDDERTRVPSPLPSPSSTSRLTEVPSSSSSGRKEVLPQAEEEVNEEPKKVSQPKISIKVSDLTSSGRKTEEEASEESTNGALKESKRHHSTIKERKITISTKPNASSHTQDGLSRLVQKHNVKGSQSIVASINSNVQGINSSILDETDYKEKNPGVHMTIFTKPTVPVCFTGKTEAKKAASSIISPQKLTYEPNIRRRCLRGLFLESSEDDVKNPQKPRRHGCRFTLSGN